MPVFMNERKRETVVKGMIHIAGATPQDGPTSYGMDMLAQKYCDFLDGAGQQA